MTDHITQRQLALVDWDFIERTDLDLSAIHWYPGSFAPGLPGVLVDLLSSPGETVFDPFCGVGSSAVSAVLRGRNSISCDISVIGVTTGLATTGLISLLVTEPRLFYEIFSDLELIVAKAKNQPIFFESPIQSSRLADDLIGAYGGESLPEIFGHLFKQPALSHLSRWYHERTLGELMHCLSALEAASTSNFCKLVGFTMISAIARAASSETRSWGHIADNVRPKEFIYKDISSAALMWLRRTKKQILSVRSSVNVCEWSPKFTFRLVDWLNDGSQGSAQPASLLLTSPPYGGAIDYGLAQRLSLYLLGETDENITRIVDAEIGARRKRFKANHVRTWASELVNSVAVQIESVHPSGCVAFVMPHKDHGRDAGEILLREVLEEKGWKLWFSSDRSVRQSRTRQSWTSIKKETILIFKKRR